MGFGNLDLTDVIDDGDDSANDIPMVTFLAPSGRVYEHQEDFEGDVKITVPRYEMGVEDESDEYGNKMVSITVPVDDLDSLMSARMRAELIAEIEEMDQDDLFRLVGLLHLFDGTTD
jgi:hypothetical protein